MQELKVNHKRGKGRNKSALLLSRINQVNNRIFTAPVLKRLIEAMPERDQADWIRHFNKPEKPKDEFESMDDETLQRLANLLKAKNQTK